MPKHWMRYVASYPTGGDAFDKASPRCLLIPSCASLRIPADLNLAKPHETVPLPLPAAGQQADGGCRTR